MRLVLSLSFVSVVAAACDQPPYIPPKAEPDTTFTNPDADVLGEDGIDPSCTIRPTLSDLQTQYFSRSCTFGGCHDDSASGDLVMEGPGLHAALVNVLAADPKARGRNKMRVVPGDPANSYFLQKLDGTMQRDEGNLMPDGSDEPVDPGCRIARVRQWIENGALDN